MVLPINIISLEEAKNQIRIKPPLL